MRLAWIDTMAVVASSDAAVPSPANEGDASKASGSMRGNY
jgi:hypothetical protein